MHELAIAQKIIDAIKTEADKIGIKEIHSVSLRVGNMAVFNKEQLEFCLTVNDKGGTLGRAKFTIEEVAVELRCTVCGNKFTDTRFDDQSFAHSIAHAPGLYSPLPCPSCACAETELIAGKEFKIISIEGE